MPEHDGPSLQDALGERYIVEEPLGMGGVGEVWRVRDPSLRRSLALKLLRPSRADADAEWRFVAEAQLTAQLEHPGVVPIHERGELPDGSPFFTMKEVRGRTLAELIQAGTPLRRLVEALLRVSETAGYAHAHGVVHRDIKPANVMLGDFGDVLLLDWGLASLEGGTDLGTDRGDFGAFATHAGRVAGTPAYMPPEQAHGLAGLGPSADVYALGAVLYEILTGRAPYGGTAREALAGLVAGPPPPLPDHAPRELVAICTRAMARRPEDRLADALALSRALRAWMDGDFRREQGSRRSDSSTRPTGSPPRCRRCGPGPPRCATRPAPASSRSRAMRRWRSAAWGGSRRTRRPGSKSRSSWRKTRWFADSRRR
jgi:serine/threonine-protein kinase